MGTIAGSDDGGAAASLRQPLTGSDNSTGSSSAAALPSDGPVAGAGVDDRTPVRWYQVWRWSRSGQLKLLLLLALAAVALTVAFKSADVRDFFENLLTWLRTHRVEGAFIMVRIARSSIATLSLTPSYTFRFLLTCLRRPCRSPSTPSAPSAWFPARF
jgi:hypothetical protein